MLYAVERVDGELEIIRLPPRFIAFEEEGEKFRVHIFNILRMDPLPYWRWRMDTPGGHRYLEIPFEDINEFGDCRPDTLAKYGFTLEFEAIERVTEQRPELGGAKWTEITTKDIPVDRTFRGAWKFASGKVGHDMGEVKELFLGRVRKARNAKLDDLDKAMNKARDERDNARIDELAAEKKSLRDLPAKIDFSFVKDIEDVKALWPSALEA